MGRLVRNYHNVNWDVRQPGDPITLPVCVNEVNWDRDVYGRWQKAGWETDISVQFSGFQPGAPNYTASWAGREQWCYDYGKALAVAFGPSGAKPLCTSMEIGNEPGSKFEPAVFKMLFTRMARGMRDGDARLKVVTPAVQARAGDDYCQDLRGGMYEDNEVLPLFDVINLHTYAAVERKNPAECPWTRSYPEDPDIAYLKVVDEAVAWRDAHGPEKEVWITEFGYDACTPEAMPKRKDWFLKLNWQGHTDLQQAQYLVRSFFAFATRDVRRAYIYYYDDSDSPSVHGCAGLTRRFAPKPAYWAVKQLYDTLGECRFKRVVEQGGEGPRVFEFERGDNSGRLVWAAWSPTGARTDQQARHTPREIKATLSGLPARPERVDGMAVADGPAPKPAWEASGPNAITLSVGESPRLHPNAPAKRRALTALGPPGTDR